jgi:hypothetical protein
MANRKKSRSSRSSKKEPKTRSTTESSSSKKTAAPAAAGNAPARSTVSGPAAGIAETAGDAQAVKFDATNKLAADMPYNANKAMEYGELSTQPPEGQTAPQMPQQPGAR